MKDKQAVILTTGSRTFNDRSRLYSELTVAIGSLNIDGYSTVVLREGGHWEGADLLVRDYLVAHRDTWQAQGIDLASDTMYAEWSKYGRSAGPRRNAEMVAKGFHIGLAFWDGTSRGTKDCIDKMTAAGNPPKIIREFSND